MMHAPRWTCWCFACDIYWIAQALLAETGSQQRRARAGGAGTGGAL